jgi:phage FluMu protein Com
LAVERLKFRCYQCNQLLASWPSKAGSIVSCPRCKADLVVPAADSTAAADPEASTVGKASGRARSTLTPPINTVPAGLDEMAAAMPADLIGLRPEDLRVEAEFFQSLTRVPEPPQEPEPAPWVAPAPAASFPRVETGFPAAPASIPPAIETEAPVFPSTARRSDFPSAFPLVTPNAPLLPPASPVVPPIEIEPTSLLPSNREFHPVREVVLPASAVLAWSLFGLIGIATSFIAGLMVGHYFWRM